MKKPEECLDLKDVRCGIDAMDREIMELLGRRLGYVLAAAQFKPTEASIAAPERVADMLVERKAWARDCGLPERFATDVFPHIIYWYIAEQTAYWRKKHGLPEVGR